MANVTFRLNRPTDPKGDLRTKPVSILVAYYHEGISVELSTGQKVLPAKWTGSRVKGVERAEMINKHLSTLEKDLLNVPINHHTSTAAEHESIVRGIIKGGHTGNVEKKNPLESFILEFIAKCEAKEIVRTRGTIQTYKAALLHLRRFAIKKRIALTFEVITQDFYNTFTAYLWDDLKHNDNTVGKTIKVLKMLMGVAFEEELHTNVTFKAKKFKKMTSETDSIYLTQDDIVKLYALDLSDSPELARTRDLFVFACWAGVRFSDLTTIRPEHIKQYPEGKLLRLTTIKTNEEVVIPFHPLAEAIYSHYDSTLPKVTRKDNVVFNRHLKLIGERAGFTSSEQQRNVTRGRTGVTWLKKFEMITTHTARRSFATNCYLMGVPTRTIMAITGHKTEKAFNKYIKVTKLEHAKILLQHFNTQPISSVMRKAN